MSGTRFGRGVSVACVIAMLSGCLPDQPASGPGSPAVDPMAKALGGSLVPIWTIQGGGAHSPYVLQTLTTQGVVTGVFPGLGGFWIQSSQPDGDPSTSDGLFVNTGELPTGVAQGDMVQVTGRVSELSDQTQIVPASASEVAILGSGAQPPEPIRLDPPADDRQALSYYEAREGMLVSLQEPAVAVGPTTIYGEYVIVLARHGVTRIMQGQPAGRRIVVDDGAATIHETRDSLAYAVKVGDRVEGVIGLLAYTAGQYKVEPLGRPRLDPAIESPPALPPTPAGEFRLMTWNAENLFDALPPHPSDPPPPSPTEYRRDLARVAATILAAGAPTVVALQEVENVGVLEDLVSMDSLAPYHYAAYLMEGSDSRGIDVGYLVRSDMAEVTRERQLPVSADLLSRPPLMIEVKLKHVTGLNTITLLNNHFTSLSAGIDLTRPRRVAQAEVIAQAVGGLLREAPSAPVAVVGDLNAFYASPPLQALSEVGLTDLFDGLEADQRYSYIYQGVSEALDHILVSPGLGACLTSFEALHLDSPYPLPAADDVSAVGKSDHDPLVASFRCSS